MADLTYDTTVISVEYLPIGIGYVTTYAAKCLPGQFSFQIYKFTDSLLDAIGASLPDILALGFFAWNKNLSLLVARHYKRLRPDGLVVLGGQALAEDADRRRELFRKNNEIDVFILYGGGLGFVETLRRYLQALVPEDWRQPIGGSVVYGRRYDLVVQGNQSHEKYGWDRRYRILPRDFGCYRGEICFEVETVAVGSKSLSFDDYLYLRGFHVILRIVFNNAFYEEYTNYLRRADADIFELCMQFYDNIRHDSSWVGKRFRLFIQETSDEIWDSREALEEHFRQEQNYSKLLAGECGENLLGKFKTLTISEHFDLWCDYYHEQVLLHLSDRQDRAELETQLADIHAHILAKAAQAISPENMRRTPVGGICGTTSPAGSRTASHGRWRTTARPSRSPTSTSSTRTRGGSSRKSPVSIAPARPCGRRSAAVITYPTFSGRATALLETSATVRVRRDA